VSKWSTHTYKSLETFKIAYKSNCYTDTFVSLQQFKNEHGLTAILLSLLLLWFILTAFVLKPGGISKAHRNTKTVHKNTQTVNRNIQTVHINTQAVQRTHKQYTETQKHYIEPHEQYTETHKQYTEYINIIQYSVSHSQILYY
jgi:tRNA/tmRNA/rRNA uracil-C5-methylase (TrmA/RlmC/RlmD family)